MGACSAVCSLQTFQPIRSALSKTIVLLTLAATLQACDFLGGVMRSYDVSGPVDFACVEKLLASHPGVAEFDYELHDGSIPLTWRGLEEPDQVHRYSYRLQGFEFETSVNFVPGAEHDCGTDLDKQHGMQAGCKNRCRPAR